MCDFSSSAFSFYNFNSILLHQKTVKKKKRVPFKGILYSTELLELKTNSWTKEASTNGNNRGNLKATLYWTQLPELQCVITNLHVFVQINMLLSFKDDICGCPCPDSIQEQLLDFHVDLMRHCGNLELR